MTSMITFYCLLLQIVRVVMHSMISHVPSVTLHSHAVRVKFVELPCLNLPRNPHQHPLASGDIDLLKPVLILSTSALSSR